MMMVMDIQSRADCDDSSAVNPDMDETCSDNIDTNCDGILGDINEMLMIAHFIIWIVMDSTELQVAHSVYVRAREFSIFGIYI